MIRTRAEYQNALERLDQEAKTITRQREHLRTEVGLSEEELKRAMQPLESFRAQLEEEVQTYEQMRRGDLQTLYTLRSLGRWLIGARIARGWTVTELAKALGVSVQQVSRDENNEYRGVSADKAQRVLEVLGVRFRAEVEDPVAETPSSHSSR
jgi:ribosome-binding protein aMBF1 (putative translation factor)